MIRINIIIGFIALVLVMGGQAVPVNSDSTEQKTTIPTSDISGLHKNAELQVFKILQQITRLELAKDINTIRDDVTSLAQLLPVIQHLANNETDEYIITKYNETIKFMENSISALNNLIRALDSKDAAPATTTENQRYENLDNFVKLSMLKLQVELTFRDLEHLPIN
ncbi:uncharacterized protein [Dysidea avara]|uniref:uncharacterized protein isoform X2 n=1 Tax=Dysidea avara TaxID=196820 RepID=UPI00332B10A9